MAIEWYLVSGSKLANLALKNSLSKIVRTFHIYPANPMDELILIPEMTMSVKDGIKVSLKQRVNI